MRGIFEMVVLILENVYLFVIVKLQELILLSYTLLK